MRSNHFEWRRIPLIGQELLYCIFKPGVILMTAGLRTDGGGYSAATGVGGVFEGNGVIIRRHPSTNLSDAQYNPWDFGCMWDLVDVTDASFRNIYFDGNRPTVAQQNEFQGGIRLRKATRVLFEGCKFYNLQGDGIGCYAAFGGLALLADFNRQVTGRKCLFDNCGRMGFFLSTGNHQFLIKDCAMVNTNGLPPNAGINCEQDNAVEGGVVPGIKDVLVRRCYIANNQRFGVDMTTGPGVSAQNVAIEDCYIEGNLWPAIKLEGRHLSARRGVIANHTFTFDSFFRTGVIMDSGTHSEVSDCFFFGNDAPAMISGRDWAGGSQRYERNYILIPAGS